jgi:hypothetical protein
MSIEEAQAKDIKQLNDKVTKILFYLESDGTTNQKGLVEKFSDMSKLIDSMLIKNYKINAIFGIVGSGIFWIVKFLITKVA